MDRKQNKFLVTVTLLVAVVVASVSSTTEDYSNDSELSRHPAVVRLQEYEQMSKNWCDTNDRLEMENFLTKEESRYSSPENYGEAMIVMLKMYAITQKTTKDYLTGITYVLRNFIKNSTVDLGAEFRNNQELADYVLDWNFHLDMLDNWSRATYYVGDVDWALYAYLLVVENSPRLKNSFSRGMLLKLNTLRNRANAFNAVYLIEETSMIEISLNDIIRFPFDKIMIDLELCDPDDSSAQLMVSEMKRAFVVESLKKAGSDITGGAKPLYTALLELSDEELGNYVNEIAYALGWYGIEEKGETVKILSSMLEGRCKRLNINGLDERLEDFEYVMAHTGEILANRSPIESKQLEYFKIISHKKNFFIKEKIVKIFNALMTTLYQQVVFNPETMNDQVKLNEYDQIVIDLNENDEFSFKYQSYNFELSLIPDILLNDTRKAIQLLDSITSSENTFDDRNRIRIYIRSIMLLSNYYLNLQTPDLNLRNIRKDEIISTISTIYVKLMSFGADVFINDPTLMTLWYKFTEINPDALHEVLNRQRIESLLQYNNAASGPSSDADAVLYIFLTRIANLLAKSYRTTDGSVLIHKILELEEKVGYAVHAPAFIQDYVLFEKQLFYIHYSTLAARYQTDLTKLVKHHVELIASIKYWTDVRSQASSEEARDMVKRQLLDVIYTAANNATNTQDHLVDPNGQLRYKVNRLMNGMNRAYGMDDEFAEKVRLCEPIFGKITN